MFEAKNFLRPEFFYAGAAMARLAGKAGQNWDEYLDRLLISDTKAGKIDRETAGELRSQNERTEAGREGVVSMIWYGLNTNTLPSPKLATNIALEGSKHLFTLRVADNYVDDGRMGSCLERLRAIRGGGGKIEEPLGRAAAYLVERCSAEYSSRPGYAAVNERLYGLVESLEVGRTNSQPRDRLESMDREIAFFTVLPVAFLLTPYSGRPTRMATGALRHMLFAARTIDHMGDLKKDFDSGQTYNFLLEAAKAENDNLTYDRIRARVDSVRGTLLGGVTREINEGGRGLEPTAAAVYWLATLLYMSKGVFEYAVLTRPGSEKLKRVARKLVRSL